MQGGGVTQPDRAALHQRCAAPLRRRSERSLSSRVNPDVFFTAPIFPTRFPTELLTTGWEMAGLNGWWLVENA